MHPPPSTLYVWGIAVVAALGGLLFGYDWVVIGGARQFFEIYFHLRSAAAVGWANSCALVGCFAGSLVAGALADRYGRKPVLLASAILFAVSSVLTGWAPNFTAFIVWRITGGVAIGLSSNISPLYIAEVSPAAHRGRLVSLNQFAVVIGILLAQIMNWLHRGTGTGSPVARSGTGLVERAARLALDVHRRRRARRNLFGRLAGHPGKPALAAHPQSQGRRNESAAPGDGHSRGCHP